jgi:hypothetical protein
MGTGRENLFNRKAHFLQIYSYPYVLLKIWSKFRSFILMIRAEFGKVRELKDNETLLDWFPNIIASENPK